jgi:hypothetical protein
MLFLLSLSQMNQMRDEVKAQRGIYDRHEGQATERQHRPVMPKRVE